MKARLVVVAAAAAVALAACSSSSSGGAGASSSAGSSSSPALAAASAAVTAALVEPTSVGVTTPLSKTPATGKNITYLTCGVGVCKQIGDQLIQATKALSWNLKQVPAGTTPEQIVAAWTTAINATPKPDAILTSGVPVSVFQAQLTQAAAEGIAVVDWASANPPNTPGIIFDINPVTDNEERGKLLADYAASKTGGKAKTLYLNVPDYKTLVAEQAAYEAQMKVNCPDTCTTDTLNFAATDIGAKVANATVSYIQAHPDINYVIPSWDDLGLGIPEALKAAGLDKQITMISQASNQVAATNIKNGNVQVATIPQGVGQMAYKAMDVLARHWNGDSLAADSANLLPIWLQTQATIGDPNVPWAGPTGPPNYAAQFEALWKVSS